MLKMVDSGDEGHVVKIEKLLSIVPSFLFIDSTIIFVYLYAKHGLLKERTLMLEQKSKMDVFGQFAKPTARENCQKWSILSSNFIQ